MHITICLYTENALSLLLPVNYYNIIIFERRRRTTPSRLVAGHPKSDPLTRGSHLHYTAKQCSQTAL